MRHARSVLQRLLVDTSRLKGRSWLTLTSEDAVRREASASMHVHAPGDAAGQDHGADAEQHHDTDAASMDGDDTKVVQLPCPHGVNRLLGAGQGRRHLQIEVTKLT